MSTQEIGGDQILDLSIGSADITDNAVTSSKIASGAVSSTHLAASAVTTPAIAAGAVTSTGLATDAVITIKIADAQVTTAKIAAGAIVNSLLATDAVASTNILAGAVTLGKIGAGAVNATALAVDSVTTAKILDGNVTSAKILDGAIVSSKLAAGSVTNTHLSSGELHFAADTTSLTNKKVLFNLEKTGVTLGTGLTTDVSAFFSGETPVTSASTTEGVVVTAPKNTVILRDANLQIIDDGANHEVYGRLTESSGVWTLTYFVMSPTETPFSMPTPVTNAHILAPRRYNLNLAPEDQFRGSAVFTDGVDGIDDHEALTVDAHDASAISILDAGGHFTATNVEDALAALAGAGWVQGSSETLGGHLADGIDAHDASAISFLPDTARTTDLTATQVNAAIEELHAEVEALQALPATIVTGFKSFQATAGQTVFSVVGATNAPFNVGDDSLMVFRGGLLQSKLAGHYTEDPSGNFITLTTAAALNTNVILKWHK